MTKTKKNLASRSLMLRQLIINNAELYANSEAGERGLLETLVGAGIWYLPNTSELFTGKISKAALLKLQSDPKKTNLVEEHPIPRKVAGRLLFTTYLEDLKQDPNFLMRMYLEQFGRYNLVLKEENNRLKKFQKTNVFTSADESYQNAGIELLDFTYEEYQDFKRLKSKTTKMEKERLNVVA